MDEFSSNRDIAVYKRRLYSSSELISSKHGTSKYQRAPSQLAASTEAHEQEESLAKKQPKLRIVITFVFYWMWLGLGLNSATTGTTLVHMGCVYGADTQQMSWSFVAVNSGFLIGAVLSGIFFGTLNPLFQFAVGVFLIGCSATVTPWMPNLMCYCLASGFSNLTQGYIGSGGFSYIVRLWPTRKRPFIQAITAMRACGSFVFPFVSFAFLVNLPLQTDECVYNKGKIISNSLFPGHLKNNSFSNKDGDNLSINLTDVYNCTNSSDSQAELNCDVEELYRVRYTFLIVGLHLICIGVAYLILICTSKPNLFSSKKEVAKPSILNAPDSSDSVSNGKALKVIKALLLILVFMFIFLIYWYEYVFAIYIPTFAIKGLNLSSEISSLLTSLYYGSFTCGRVISVFISIILSPTKMITLSSIFTLLAFTMLLFVDQSDWIIWLGIPLSGFSVSSIFPSAVVWLSDYMVYTGAISATVMVDASVGAMTGSLLAGYLLETYIYKSLVYFCLCSSVANVLIFAFMVLTGWFYRKIEAKTEER